MGSGMPSQGANTGIVKTSRTVTSTIPSTQHQLNMEGYIRNNLIKLVVIVLITLGVGTFVRTAELNNQKLELKTIQIKSTSTELKLLKGKYDVLNQELDQAKGNAERVKQLEAEQVKLQEDKVKLEKDLQAKLEAKRLASSKNTVQASAVPGGDWVTQCHAWAAQAGVSLNDSAIKLLERESHCNPVSRNPTSSAGGIPQALPWTKMGCELSVAGAPCQIRWFQAYVNGRYGSFEKALAHSYAKGWY